MKKQLTKAQRHKIYKKVLKMNCKNNINGQQTGPLGFCDLASKVVFDSHFEFDKIDKDLFPEYFLFSPPKEFFGYWFGESVFGSLFGNDIRQLVLMFCIEMTK